MRASSASQRDNRLVIYNTQCASGVFHARAPGWLGRSDFLARAQLPYSIKYRRGLLAGESRYQDEAAPLTDRSTSVGGEVYSDAFETFSEDEMAEAKPASQAGLLPSALLGYTWT